MTELDQIKATLKSAGHILPLLLHEDVAVPNGGNFRCILPGHDDRDPSANIHTDAAGIEHYHCFGCNRDFDIIALYQVLHGCDFMSALRELATIFNLPWPDRLGNGAAGRTDGATMRGEAKQEKPVEAAQGATGATGRTEPDDATKIYVAACAARIWSDDGKAGLDYLRNRCIGDETIRKFNIGFDPKQGNDGAVIVPYGSRFFKRFLTPVLTKNGRKLKGLFDGPKGTFRPVFNEHAIYAAGDFNVPIFITEGEIDALSIIETGASAVAIGGVNGGGKLLDIARQLGCGCFVPCLDRDMGTDPNNPDKHSGEDAQAKLEAGLAAIPGVYVFKGAPKLLLPDGADGTHPKDANEALVADRAGFAARVRLIAEQARSAADEAREKREAEQKDGDVFNRDLGGLLLRRFSDIPQTLPEDEDPDALIKGYALARGEGWILAGEPGVGKSSFIIQFAMFAAAGKQFFGWEFSRPLKVFYLQTELQNRKLEQSRNSILQRMKATWGWTDTEMTLANENLAYDECMIGSTCDAVANYLKSVWAKWPFDLLFLDPLLTFTEDDPSLVKPMKELLYKNITTAMGGRERTADGKQIKFAAIISHHTGKPRFEKGRLLDRGQYNTAGSFAINAWARFQLNLTHHKGRIYRLLAAKNPEVAPWRSDDGAFVDSLLIKRAERGERFWEKASENDLAEAEETTKKEKAERRHGGDDAQEAKFDLKVAALEFAKRLNAADSSMTGSDARKLATGLFGAKNGGAVFCAVRDDAKAAAESGTPGLYCVAYSTRKSKRGQPTILLGGAAQSLPMAAGSAAVEDGSLDGGDDSDGDNSDGDEELDDENFDF